MLLSTLVLLHPAVSQDICHFRQYVDVLRRRCVDVSLRSVRVIRIPLSSKVWIYVYICDICGYICSDLSVYMCIYVYVCVCVDGFYMLRRRAKVGGWRKESWSVDFVFDFSIVVVVAFFSHESRTRRSPYPHIAFVFILRRSLVEVLCVGIVGVRL
jgi:hypothetical protein